MRANIGIFAIITYLCQFISSLRYLENPVDYFKGEDDTVRCPRIVCGSLNGTCAERQANLILNKNFTLQTCKQSYERCPMGIQDIYSMEFESKKCENKTTTDVVRYPGEKCDKHEECSKFGGKGCVNAKCNATDPVNNTCAGDTDCAAGNYCNTTHCVKQIALKENCTRSLECINSAGCYDGKCTE